MATILALAACGNPPEAGAGAMFGGPVPVSVLGARAETLPVNLEYTAQALGSREVEVRARGAGILIRRNYTEGGKVRAGQSLFTIDPAPFANAVARAEYFPSVGLTAYLGGESVAFSKLFTGPAGIFQFAAAITQPLWNAGRLRAGTQVSEARRVQALADYQKAVASAFKDVRDTLAAQNVAREILAAESARAAALAQALGQARLRFDAGIASQLDVLDVERNLLAAELARIDAERARQAALADLFKALGGGWVETSRGG